MGLGWNFFWSWSIVIFKGGVISECIFYSPRNEQNNCRLNFEPRVKSLGTVIWFVFWGLWKIETIFWDCYSMFMHLHLHQIFKYTLHINKIKTFPVKFDKLPKKNYVTPLCNLKLESWDMATWSALHNGRSQYSSPE